MEELRDLTDELDLSHDASNDAATRERVQSAMNRVRDPPTRSISQRHSHVSQNPMPPLKGSSHPSRPSPPSNPSPSSPILPPSSGVRPSSPFVRPEGEKPEPVLVSPSNVSNTPTNPSTTPASTPMKPKTQPSKRVVPSPLRRSLRLQAPPLRRSKRLQAKRESLRESLPPALHFLSLFAAIDISPMSVLADPRTQIPTPTMKLCVQNTERNLLRLL